MVAIELVALLQQEHVGSRGRWLAAAILRIPYIEFELGIRRQLHCRPCEASRLSLRMHDELVLEHEVVIVAIAIPVTIAITIAIAIAIVTVGMLVAVVLRVLVVVVSRIDTRTAIAHLMGRTTLIIAWRQLYQ